MVKKSLFFLFLLLLLTACGKHSATETSSSTMKKPSQVTTKMLSISKVKTIIQNTEKGKNVTNLHIIGIKNEGDMGAAFASFELDGDLKYVSITVSKQETGTGVFAVSDSKNTPIQYTETVGKSGYDTITGVVNNSSGIKNVIITYSNGQIKEVPVVKNTFFFLGKIGNTEKDTYSKEAIGVTANGAIVSSNKKK